MYRINILFYFNDPQVQAIAQNLNWSGEVKAVSGDYLMVVDANLAAFKTDRVMEENIFYSLNKSASGVLSKVVVDYKHTGGFDWKTTRYRSYVRVYVPRGSKLVKASGFGDGDIDISQDDFGREGYAKDYFGGFVSVEPGESAIISIIFIA